MQYQILTTCGTSALTNPAKRENLSDALTRYSNAKTEIDIPCEVWQAVESLWGKQIDLWQQYTIDDAKKNSAELNALTTWQEQNEITPADCYCKLIHTDTIFGKLAAQLLEEWLQANGYQGVELIPIDNLNTLGLESFEVGLSNLAKWTFESTSPSKDVRYIFNVAGGFKSVSGFMQVLGQFVADETIYMFESGDVLSIPKLPVTWTDIESIKNQFESYHKISFGIAIKSYEQLNPLWVRDGHFTPWGQIAWENAKRILYSQEVYKIVCPGIIEGPRFRESLKGLSADRIYLINERLDDLSVYVISDRKNAIKRLDYKQLRGKHTYTHELDAWADKDARRIFCTEQGGCIILEELGEALH